MSRVRLSAAVAITVTGVIASGALVALPLAAQGASAVNCAALNDAIAYQVNPDSQTGMLVPDTAGNRRLAEDAGFTTAKGVLFRAAAQSDSSLRAVHSLYKASTNDYLFTLNSGEISKALEKGYVERGGTFSAAPSAAACTVPVYRFLKKAHHSYAVSADDRKALTDDGWTQEGVAFHVASPSTGGGDERNARPVDTTFTFAAMPDTQQEVLDSRDKRFANRTRWLAEHKDELDLRFVADSGDVVNWDTPDHSQYKIASAAMTELEKAKIPYTLTIGNHDTQATDAPGGARDPKRTRLLQKDTTTFNAFFNADRYTHVAGAFEEGKVDNLYTSYTEGDTKWMVLTLELWPRKSVVAWANEVVAEHPDHNVIITTHNYIDGSGNLGQSASYGDTSPQYLYDNLVKKYTNIKFVLCGHVGRAGVRVDTGINGNKIISFNQTYHSNTTNPVRLIEVDTKAGTVTSKVVAPFTGETFAIHGTSHSGMQFIR